MKKLMLTVVGTSMLLGAGVASAQGLPPDTVPPIYGSHAFPSSTQSSVGARITNVDRSQAAPVSGRNARTERDVSMSTPATAHAAPDRVN